MATIVLVFALAVPVFANPGQNPNRNPGSPEVTVGEYTVRVTGGGNNLVIDILRDGAVVYGRVSRAGNGTFSQTFTTTSGNEIFIQVQGNSLRNFTVTAPEVVIEREYSFYRFVELNQVASYFTGTSEVENSREFNGEAAKYNWIRSNNIPGVNGMGVITGARVTGTLTYEYVRNYVEQFERVYEWVDVTVWSNGNTVEVVREDSEHVRGGLVDGESYYTGPYDGSRAIEVTTDDVVVLHMGNGQSSEYSRDFISTVNGFTVELNLRNTANPPTIDVTITGYDVNTL